MAAFTTSLSTTTSFPYFNPSPVKTARTVSSNLFPSPSTSASRCSVISLLSTTGAGVAVVARQGGRRAYRPRPKPNKRTASEGRGGGGLDFDNSALDISRITSNTVRLIDDKQNMVGIVSIDEAIEMANDVEKDLVIVSEAADPPVLKIMDYSKYKYEQRKKKRDQQKKSAATHMDMKELKMGYTIESHDYSVRLKAAKKFLNDGDKVKVIVNAKGRENEFRKSDAIELIKRFQTDVGELGSQESINLSERNIFMVLLPNKTIIQKASEKPKKKDDAAIELSANV